MLQLADVTIENQLATQAEVPVRALHAARLKDSPVPSDRIDHGPGLGNRLRERLFAIDVLARLGGPDHCNRMPVVGRGYHHRVDIVSSQQIAKIAISIAAFIQTAFLASVVIFDDLLAACELELVHVAGGEDLGPRRIQKRSHQMLALLARADKAQRNPLARRTAGST